MSVLTVRDLDPEVKEKLRQRAARHGRQHCWVHRAALATRNSRDFEACGLDVVHPYEF